MLYPTMLDGTPLNENNNKQDVPVIKPILGNVQYQFIDCIPVPS